MKTFWIAVTIMSILAQIPHAYWAIEDFSIIKNKKMRVIQNASFCLILSLMIFGFVIEGLHWYALGGAVIEIVINVYYFQRGMDRVNDETKAKKWLRHVLAIVMPILVFVAALMINLHN